MATVLVIDDDTALLAASRVGLRPCHQIRTAATGDAGLSDAAVYPPAVVVLDLGLPDMDGMQVFHQLRGWTQIPVIILFADGSEDRKVEAPERRRRRLRHQTLRHARTRRPVTRRGTG